MAVGESPVTMTSPEGKRLPTQIQPREKAEINGIDLPRNDMFPAEVYRKILFMTDGRADIGRYEAVPQDAAACVQSDLIVTDSAIENRCLRVEARGALIDIIDKRSGRPGTG